MRSRLTQAGVGTVAGALLTLVGIVLAPDAAPGPASTTTTTGSAPAAPGPFWHDPHETIVGPAAIIPVSLVIEDGEAVLAYRIEPITPARQGIVFEQESGPPVAPEVFVLTAAGSEYVGTAARTGSTEVRFDVPTGISRDDVEGLRIDRHWLRLPHESDIALPAMRGASFEIDELVTVTVEAVVTQSTGSLINLDTTRRSNEFIADRNPLVWVFGRGPGWRSTVRQSGAGIGGSTGIQLSFSGDTLPDPMPLTVEVPQWIPYDRPVQLDLGGVLSDR